MNFPKNVSGVSQFIRLLVGYSNERNFINCYGFWVNWFAFYGV
jgi:hypothetical protein